jgi:peptidoglycan/LPS O-acetylase OafA/YrhL
VFATLGYRAAVANAPAQAWYWSYLSNVRVAQTGGGWPPHIGVFWSLAVEEHFYLAWPFLVRWLARGTLIRLCLGIAVACLFLRIALVAAGVAPIAAYVLTPTRVDTLAMGALVALLRRGGLPDGALRRGAKVALAAGVLLLLVVVAQERPFANERPLVVTLGLSAFGLIYASILALVVAAEKAGPIGRALAQPWLGAIGRYSYGMYVMHTLIIDVCKSRLLAPDSVPALWGSSLPGEAVFLVAVLGLTFAAAWLSWHLVERPFLALKRYVPM